MKGKVALQIACNVFLCVFFKFYFSVQIENTWFINIALFNVATKKTKP